jgi:hypothetical protein
LAAINQQQHTSSSRNMTLALPMIRPATYRNALWIAPTETG